jgi:hypothetical protein
MHGDDDQIVPIGASRLDGGVMAGRDASSLSSSGPARTQDCSAGNRILGMQRLQHDDGLIVLWRLSFSKLSEGLDELNAEPFRRNRGLRAGQRHEIVSTQLLARRSGGLGDTV